MYIARRWLARQKRITQKQISDQEAKYNQMYQPAQVMPSPELRTPMHHSVEDQFYTVPKFNPKKDKLILEADQLSIYEKIDSELVWKDPIWSIEQIVEFLKLRRMQDIVTIRIGSNRGGTDYLIMTTGMTKRHLTVTGEELFSEFKKDLRQYVANNDKISRLHHLEEQVAIEGNRGSSDWVCVNVLNATVHFLTEFSRENLCLEELHLLNHHDPFSQDQILKDDRQQQEDVNKLVFKVALGKGWVLEPELLSPSHLSLPQPPFPR